jgi:hypothetical protein
VHHLRVQVQQIVQINQVGHEITTNGEEMILIGLIGEQNHHIIIDGKHKMIQNGDEVLLILLLLIEHEQRLHEDNDHVQVDIMFQVKKIGKKHVIPFHEQIVQIIQQLLMQ